VRTAAHLARTVTAAWVKEVLATPAIWETGQPPRIAEWPLALNRRLGFSKRTGQEICSALFGRSDWSLEDVLI